MRGGPNRPRASLPSPHSTPPPHTQSKAEYESPARAQPYWSRVRKWTKGADLFTLDYVFVPVHDAQHWSLAIACFPGGGPGRCILHLDSLSQGGGLHSPEQVAGSIRAYLQVCVLGGGGRLVG